MNASAKKSREAVAPMLPVTETLLSIPEPDLVKHSSQERIGRFVRDGCFFNEANGALVSFGNFDTPTVEALKEQVSKLSVAANKDNEKEPQRSVPPALTTRSGVDIGELQGKLTTSDRAMIQVASNFNCLENPHRRYPLDSGRLVDKAFKDRTQGPAAVFGTTSSYLYRAHFYQGGQSLPGNKPINLLKNTRQYFGTPEVGKLTLTGREVHLETEAEIEQATAKVCVGLHQDCPIMFGRSKGSLLYNEPSTKKKKSSDDNDETKDHGGGGGAAAPLIELQYPLVDQVFNASINLYDFGVEKGMTEQAMVNLMRALLRAAYEGIYLAAILRQRRKLYLTLVGGGVFGNPIPLIVQEIQRAHNEWAGHPASVLEEVVICLYSQNDENHVKAAMKRHV